MIKTSKNKRDLKTNKHYNNFSVQLKLKTTLIMFYSFIDDIGQSDCKCVCVFLVGIFFCLLILKSKKLIRYIYHTAPALKKTQNEYAIPDTGYLQVTNEQYELNFSEDTENKGSENNTSKYMSSNYDEIDV